MTRPVGATLFSQLLINGLKFRGADLHTPKKRADIVAQRLQGCARQIRTTDDQKDMRKLLGQRTPNIISVADCRTFDLPTPIQALSDLGSVMHIEAEGRTQEVVLLEEIHPSLVALLRAYCIDYRLRWDNSDKIAKPVRINREEDVRALEKQILPAIETLWGLKAVLWARVICVSEAKRPGNKTFEIRPVREEKILFENLKGTGTNPLHFINPFDGQPLDATNLLDRERVLGYLLAGA